MSMIIDMLLELLNDPRFWIIALVALCIMMVVLG